MLRAERPHSCQPAHLSKPGYLLPEWGVYPALLSVEVMTVGLFHLCLGLGEGLGGDPGDTEVLSSSTDLGTEKN